MHALESRPFSFYILTVLIFFQALSGLFGGGALILDPTGSSLQMPLTLLDGSPFNNYLIPGLILFAVLGVFPLIVFFDLLKRKSWAWSGAGAVSAALIIWIGVEIVMVGYHADPPLQLFYGLIGIFMLILAQLPGVKRTLKSENIS